MPETKNVQLIYLRKASANLSIYLVYSSLLFTSLNIIIENNISCVAKFTLQSRL